MLRPGRILVLAPMVLALAACTEAAPARMVGTLERDRIELKVESDEPVMAIAVADGATVTAGQLILQQDPARARLAVAERRALRDQAAARLAELERGPRAEQITQARAHLAAARAAAERASADYRREQDVFKRKLSTAAKRDDARSAWQAATATRDAAQAALDELLHGSTPEQLAQARAAVATADATLAAARLTLQRTRLTAPIAGVIDQVIVKQGERPAKDSTVAVLLAGGAPYARIYVPETMRARLRPGTQLTVRIDGHTEPLTGRVRWVSADASFTPYFALNERDRARLSYLAEVDLPGAAKLPTGLPLQATLP